MAGLASVFIIDGTTVQATEQPPQFMFDQCAAMSIPTTGNAAGLNSTTDFPGLTTGPWPQKQGWHAKGIGALAGCIITALLGMATVVWSVPGARHLR